MPKYIFKKNEYVRFAKDYADSAETEYTGRKYQATKTKSFLLPGESQLADKYGYSLGINIGINSFAPGGIYEPHKHTRPQFYYVLSGKAKVKVEDEERVVGPGTWVVTPPGVPHGLVNIGKKPFTYITCDTLHDV